MKLSLSVLGHFQASLGGKSLAYFRTRKVQALLIFLLTEAARRPGVAHSREAIMELLWPGLPLKSAQENLRSTVYQLRKTLTEAAGDAGPSILSPNRQKLELNPGFEYEVDTARFTELLQAAERAGVHPAGEYLVEAVELYRGDFLSDFYLVDSTNFEEWASAQRSAYREMALGALIKLSQAALDSAEYAKAEAYLRRHLEIDPMDEQVTRQLVRALALQGKRSAALSHFEGFRQRLVEQLGLQPGADLLELIEVVRAEGNIPAQIQLRAKAARPETNRATRFLDASEPFFARQEQLEQLHKQLNAALAGQERVVFITGEAGMGKTALMHEFARRAQTVVDGLLVVKGTGNAITGAGDPYLPFREVLNSLPGQVEVEIEKPWSAVGTRELLFDRYTQTLRQLSDQRPLLILLDDLQWADVASISLLFHLGRQLEGSRILIVGAYRPSEVRLARQLAGEQQPHALMTVVNELTRQFGDIQVNLDHFSPKEGRILVDTYLDQADSLRNNRLGEDFRSKLFWKTRGHPLFMVELLREMQARGDLARDDQGRWVDIPHLDWNILPARVEALIQQRISRLEPGLLDILSAASLEGEEFTVQVVAQVAGVDEQTTFRALSNELDKRHGLVRPHAELQIGPVHLSRYQFAHALFQQFLSEQLNQGERRLLHARIASVLEEIQSQSGQAFTLQLAYHYSQAGNSSKAVAYLLMAGDQARTLYALSEATGHYQNAIQILLESGDYDGAAHAFMKLGLTHHSAFNYDQARQAYAQGFKLWQQVGERAAVPIKPPAPHPLRLAWGEPQSLDPSMGGTNLTAPIVTQLFSGLVALDADMEVVPDIALSWDMLDEGRKYVFHLRSDVFWSDGQPVTAADFEFTFKRALDPATQAPIAGVLLDSIRGARDFREGKSLGAHSLGVYAENDLTLVVELEEPVSYFLQQLTYYVLLPVPKHIVQAYGAAWAEPQTIVTNGPFLLAEWEKGVKMRLERYPLYHGRFTGNLEQVELSLGLDAQEQIERYEAGEHDVLVNWFISSAQMLNLIQRRSAELTTWPKFATTYLIVNPSRSPFDDRRVRQALALAINKPEIIRSINENQELPAQGGFTPPGMPGHAGQAGLSYDTDQARQLLADAGWQDGGDFLPAVFMTIPARQSLAAFLIEQWREILGIELDLDIRPVETFIDDFLKARPAVVLAGWWADYADPENFLRVCVQMDVPEWHHPSYESLLEQARCTIDQDQRMEIYRQADHILMSDAVIVPLIYAQGYGLVQPWVKNYRNTAVKHPGFWKDVVIDPH